MRGSIEERFWDKVKRQGTDQCWPWLAGCYHASGPNMYGCIWAGGKMRGAHRVSWELHFGPIPTGAQVLHHCDNPRCVNPHHLFLGTNYDNVQDKMRKGRLGPRGGESNGRSVLTKDQIVGVRRRYAANEAYQRELAEEYGVTQATISSIVRGDRWPQAGGPIVKKPKRTRLTPADVISIRQEYGAGHITQGHLADKYGVSQVQISAIVRRKCWKDIEGG